MRQITAEDLRNAVDHMRPIWDLEDQWVGGGKNWEIIRKAYEIMTPRIVSALSRGGRVDPYFLPWEFTPIEAYAWQDIRGMSLPFYPQIPVGGFFIDFGDPHQRIGVELDGKEFHNEERDTWRDNVLWEEHRWKIYRVPGWQSLPSKEPVFEPGWESEREYDRPLFRNRLMNWAATSSEGLFWALRMFYYRRPKRPDTDLMDAAFYALDTHRYADFDIGPLPGEEHFEEED